jgi:hypothetical protein
MNKQVALSPEEALDRQALRDLVEAYSRCAHRRDSRGQLALFAADPRFVVFMNARDPKPTHELLCREALAPFLDDLNRYAATQYFVGQSTILTLTRERATGEAYTISQHLTIEGGKRRPMIAAFRYGDSFVKEDGTWLFAERNLYVDWVSAAPHNRGWAAAPDDRGPSPR